MKLPITDKFLWKLYHLAEEINDTYDFLCAPRTWDRIIYPDLYKIRRMEARKIGEKNFSSLIYYLKKNGYIEIANLKQKEAILLTKKGLDKIFRIKLKLTKRKRRKDKRWEMVIFDIPEKKRLLRRVFRENLQILEYKMLQQSVWVCPYDVGKETEAIVRKYSLDPYVRIFLIKEIKI